VWDAATGRHLATLEGTLGGVIALAFDPRARQIAAASLNGKVSLHDATSGRAVLVPRPNGEEPVTDVAFSPRGDTLAWDGLVVWDLKAGRQRDGFSRSAETVAFSRDGRRLASAVPEGVIEVYEVVTGRLALTLPGHKGGVFRLAWGPSGRRLASTGWDKTVRVWDVQTRKEALRLPEKTWSLAFTRDGQRLLTLWDRGKVTAWDTRTGEGKVLLRLSGKGNRVWDLALSPCGSRLATAHEDGTVRIWSVKQLLRRGGR
jgi:WD40 repeat protein